MPTDPYWVNPLADADALIPVGCVVATPTRAEQAAWWGALQVAHEVLRIDPSRIRVIWFAGDAPFLGQSWPTDPSVVLLQAGQSTRALIALALHELKHLHQFQFSARRWSAAEAERDAQQWAGAMLRRFR